MIPTLRWQKSTFSDGGNGNTCVELACSVDGIYLRESDTPVETLTTTPTALAHLLLGIREGLSPR